MRAEGAEDAKEEEQVEPKGIHRPTVRLPEGHSFRFTHAIVRTPGASEVDGLRVFDRGAPDVPTFRNEHATYVATKDKDDDGERR